MMNIVAAGGSGHTEVDDVIAKFRTAVGQGQGASKSTAVKLSARTAGADGVFEGKKVYGYAAATVTCRGKDGDVEVLLGRNLVVEMHRGTGRAPSSPAGVCPARPRYGIVVLIYSAPNTDFCQ